MSTAWNLTLLSIKEDTKVEVESTPESQPSGKIYASVVTQPKPEYAEKYQSLAQQTVAMSKEEQTTVSEPAKEPEFNISKVSNLDLNPARSAFSSQDGYDVPEPPPFLLKKEEGNDEQEDIKDPNSGKSDLSKLAENQTETAVDASVAGNNGIKETLTEQARNLVKQKKSSINRKRKEPKIAEDQMRIDFEDEDVDLFKTELPVRIVCFSAGYCF